jgi:protoporphyrinogen/coproporphyrinogen III oxidase
VQSDVPRRVAVIGGGISGLAAAVQLQQSDPTLSWQLFEAEDRFGGVLQTERRDGYLIEQSADMFTTQEPWAVQLCEQFGLADQLIPTDESRRRAFVLRRGKLHPVPLGFSLLQPQRLASIVNTPLLSWRGKLRMLAEYLQPARRNEEDESLADFSRRRFGAEAFDRLIQPLVGGIYTADPEKLSMQATLNRFLVMEREHGGLIRATLAARKRRDPGKSAERQASGARYGLFLTPREGLESLVESLVQSLPATSLQAGCRVVQVARDPRGMWRVEFQRGGRAEREVEVEYFEGLILATPASHAARLLQPVHAELSRGLQGIPLAGAAVVMAGFRKDQIRHPLNGFGFVVPLIERRKILSASFASIKFPGRAPEGEVLIRIFVGGACQPELLERSDAEIERMALDDLADIMGIQGEPRFSLLRRWHGTMPQYHLGHRERVQQIERDAASLPQLQLAGNAYHGVGIPFCIQSGRQAAERLLGQLTSPRNLTSPQ